MPSGGEAAISFLACGCFAKAERLGDRLFLFAEQKLPERCSVVTPLLHVVIGGDAIVS